MRRLPVSLLLFFLLSNAFGVYAQFKVTFYVRTESKFKPEKIFVAGNFNGWDPAKTVLLRSGNNKVVTIPVNSGAIEYKFTGGSWETVETGKEGKDLANRKAIITSDTTILVNVEGWRQPGKQPVVHSTRSPRVKIMKADFEVPQLNTTRRIWIYLPKSYAKSKSKYYPVLYMHDGQNLFDAATAPFGEWGIDEALDTLQPKHREAIGSSPPRAQCKGEH